VKREERIELRFTIETYLPQLFINISTAILIWLFGVLFFIPTAVKIEPSNLPVITSIILLIPFTLFVLKSLKGLLVIIPILANTLAKKMTERRKKSDNVKFVRVQINKIVKCLIYSSSVILFYLLYLPLINIISTSLNGLILILVILWVIWIILREVVLT